MAVRVAPILVRLGCAEVIFALDGESSRVALTQGSKTCGTPAFDRRSAVETEGGERLVRANI